MRSVRAYSSHALNPAEIAPSAAGCFLPAADTSINSPSAAIRDAAAWYREHTYDCERPLIPALQRRFGLTVPEVLAALREASVR